MSIEQLIALSFLSILGQLVRNPARKAQLRSVALRIRDAITLIYEPQQLQGSVNQRVDVAAFIRTSVEREAMSIRPMNYKAGSFDLSDDDDDEQIAKGGKGSRRQSGSEATE